MPAAPRRPELVDLWIGGLAEAKPEFGGMLGTTFNYVFEFQMENLQNGDRFYYLTRTQGTNFLNQLEPNSFTDIVMRNTALGDIYATHLSGAAVRDARSVPRAGRRHRADRLQRRGYRHAGDFDPTWAADEPHPLTTPLKVDASRAAPRSSDQGTGDTHDVGGTFKFYGPEHVRDGRHRRQRPHLQRQGNDTLWGDGGNDYLNGGTAADDVFGGDGDDIIEDPFGDDVLRGKKGNDVISDSRGANMLFGDEGQDYILRRPGRDRSLRRLRDRLHPRRQRQRLPPGQ